MTARRVVIVLVLAAGLALAAVAAFRVSLSQALAETTAEAEDLSVYLAQMSTELRSTRADAELLVDLLAVLDDEGLRVVELRGGAGVPASARVLAGREGFVLLARSLPEPPSDRLYQVWIEAPPGGPSSGGTFDVNPFGLATVVRFSPIPVGAHILVTDEPAGGSAAPTTEPILSGS